MQSERPDAAALRWQRGRAERDLGDKRRRLERLLRGQRGARAGCVTRATACTSPRKRRRRERRCNLYRCHERDDHVDRRALQRRLGGLGEPHGRPVGRVTSSPTGRSRRRHLTRLAQRAATSRSCRSRPLTGYDNFDANTHAGVRDEEVYLYDAARRLLTCASCNPSGPSVGVHDTQHSGEGRACSSIAARTGRAVPGRQRPRVDAARPRRRHPPASYLSNSGRLFFNSPDQLVPQATNAKEDVYEFEPDGVGSCHAAKAASR